jgi:hypothetical protein
VTPAGAVQLQTPTVVKVRIISPFAAVVSMGTQLFALAGTGIETKRLISRIAETIVAIFERAALTFMRTDPNDTFTSLLE